MPIQVGGAPITEDELTMPTTSVTNVVGSPPIPTYSSPPCAAFPCATVGLQTADYLTFTAIGGFLIAILAAFVASVKAVKGAKKHRRIIIVVLALILSGVIVGWYTC